MKKQSIIPRGSPLFSVRTMMSKPRKDQKWQPKQPMRYWLVDITLTSGEELQFYITARDAVQANLKAEDYAELAQNKSLAKFYKEYRLRP